MATHDITLRNPENTIIEAHHTLSFDAAAPAQPVNVNAVSPVGTIVAGALPTQQLVTATGAQVSTTRDVEVHTLFTSDASNNIATVAVALSPDNSTYSTLYTVSMAAALNNLGALAIPLVIRVPAGWYIKVTATRFTIGLSTYY